MRSAGLWVFAAILLALAGVAIARPEVRRRACGRWRSSAPSGCSSPLPWYAYLQSDYGNPVFGRSSARCRQGGRPRPGPGASLAARLARHPARSRPAALVLHERRPAGVVHRASPRELSLPASCPCSTPRRGATTSGSGAGAPGRRVPRCRRRSTVGSCSRASWEPADVPRARRLVGAPRARAPAAPASAIELLAVALMPLAALAAVFYYASHYVERGRRHDEGDVPAPGDPVSRDRLRVRGRRHPSACAAPRAGADRVARSSAAPSRSATASRDARRPSSSDEWPFSAGGAARRLGCCSLSSWSDTLVDRRLNPSPSAVALTVKCLRNEKGLPVETGAIDPIGKTADGGVARTRIEGNRGQRS